MIPSDEELIIYCERIDDASQGVSYTLHEVRDRAYRAGQIDALKRCAESHCWACKDKLPTRITPWSQKYKELEHQRADDPNVWRLCDAQFENKEIARLESENK